MKSRAVKSPFYSRLSRIPATRFRIIALSRSRSDDEPSTRKGVRGSDAAKWHSAMQTEISAVNQLDCWERVVRPKDMNVLHTQFVL